MSIPYHSLPGHKTLGETIPESRLSGVELLEGREFDSVLDLGCAEGLITSFVVEKGARIAHGIDGSEERIARANEYHAPLFDRQCHDWGFYKADFSDLKALFFDFREILLTRYDVVLALGVFHKVRGQEAREIVHRLTERCEKFLLYRGGMCKDKNMVSYFAECGFRLEKKIRYRGKAVTEAASAPKKPAPLYFFSRSPYYCRSRLGEYLASWGL